MKTRAPTVSRMAIATNAGGVPAVCKHFVAVRPLTARPQRNEVAFVEGDCKGVAVHFTGGVSDVFAHTPPSQTPQWLTCTIHILRTISQVA